MIGSKTGMILVILLLAGVSLYGQSSALVDPMPAVRAATLNVLTVPAGEALDLELKTPLNTAVARRGDRADFALTREVLVDNQIALPRGTTVHAVITSARRAAPFKKPELEMQFNEIVLPDGSRRRLTANISSSEPSPPQGERRTGRAARTIMGRAAAVAILGALVGGRRGAIAGGATGLAVGTLEVMIQRRPEIDYPPGMLLEISLAQPLRIPVMITAAADTGDGAVRTGLNSGPRRSDTLVDDDVPRWSVHPPRDSTVLAANRTVLPSPVSATSAAPGPTTAAPFAAASRVAAYPSAFKIKAYSDVVVVEATVRDHSGAIVDTLKRDDFHVLEDGVEQRVQYFSRDEFPLAVALVVDRSGSMRPVLRELRRAAYDTLSQLKPEDEVALFAFASTSERLEDLTPDRQRIARAVGRISAGGGTNITDALYQAALYLGRAAPERRHAIVLLSDNEGTVPGYSSDNDVVRMALETQTAIYSIKVQAGRYGRLMFSVPGFNLTSVPRTCRQTGGEVIDARGAASVPSAMAAVVSRLKERYSLGYVSTNLRRDGRFRAIEVRVGNSRMPLYNIYARRGYYAPMDRANAESR